MTTHRYSILSPSVRLVALLMLTIGLLPRTPIAANLDHLKSLISDLASVHPQIRESALGSLMDLHRKDLPDLHEAALSLHPLLPAQIASLREAVTQVYLAGEKYQADFDNPGAFLGIRFTYNEQPEGMQVVDRIPGFASYRFLQAGDIIIQLIDFPAIKLQNVNVFLEAVQRCMPGDNLRLRILRAGRPMNVSIPLDFRPADITRPGVPSEASGDAWIHDRALRAEQYWQQNFSAIDPGAQPDESQASTSLEQ